VTRRRREKRKKKEKEKGRKIVYVLSGHFGKIHGLHSLAWDKIPIALLRHAALIS